MMAYTASKSEFTSFKNDLLPTEIYPETNLL